MTGCLATLPTSASNAFCSRPSLNTNGTGAPMTQPPAPDPTRPYGRGGKPRPLVVSAHLAADAAIAVRQVMTQHHLSASGAVHHLVRLGAGLDSLLP